MQEAANAAELKRIIEGLPLETSAVAAVEWRLVQLDPPSFAALLTELARDNHAFRYTAAAIDSNFILPGMDLVQVSAALANDHQYLIRERVLKYSRIGYGSLTGYALQCGLIKCSSLEIDSFIQRLSKRQTKP